MPQRKKMPTRRRRAAKPQKTMVPRMFSRADFVPDRIIKTHTLSITYKFTPTANMAGYTQEYNGVLAIKMNSGRKPFNTAGALRSGTWTPILSANLNPQDEDILFLKRYLSSSTNYATSGLAYQRAVVVGSKVSASIRAKPESNRSDYSDCLLALVNDDLPQAADFQTTAGGKFCSFNDQLEWQRTRSGETKQHVGGAPKGCFLQQKYSARKALGLNKGDSLTQSGGQSFTSDTDPSHIHYALLTIQPKGMNAANGNVFDLDADHFIDIKLEQTIMYWKPQLQLNQPVTEGAVSG